MNQPSISASLSANPTLLHLIYGELLYRCLTLKEDDARTLARLYAMPEELNKGYGKFMSGNQSDLYFQGIRTIPGWLLNRLACDHLQKRYELEGVPGFYFQGTWRLNLHGRGFLRPYHDEMNRIIGLFIYSKPTVAPGLLSSAGLYKGTEAIQPTEYTGRELVA